MYVWRVWYVISCWVSLKTSLTYFRLPTEQREALMMQVSWGMEMDACLPFGPHVEERLHLLRKLKSFNISKDILTVVDKSLIDSILTYDISTWFNFLTIKHKTKISQIINQTSQWWEKPSSSPRTPLNPSTVFSNFMIYLFLPSVLCFKPVVFVWGKLNVQMCF